MENRYEWAIRMEYDKSMQATLSWRRIHSFICEQMMTIRSNGWMGWHEMEQGGLFKGGGW